MRPIPYALRVNNNAGRIFMPTDLFASAEKGVWYDPADFSTLFQDGAGTTPVTAVGQPVGLMLDKSKGLALGADILSNGTFDTDTLWTKDPGWTISGGKATLSELTSGRMIYQLGVATAGKVYRVTYEVVTVTSGAATLYFGGNTGVSRSVPGVYTEILTMGSTNTRSGVVSDPTFLGSIDNISIQEVQGSHATQSTATARPILSARYNQLIRTEDFSDSAWSKNGATTATANVITLPNLNEAISQSVAMSATQGVSGTFSVELSGSGTVYIAVFRQGGGTYEETRIKITLTPTPTRYSIAHVILNTGQTGFGGYISRSVDGTATSVTASKADLRHTNESIRLPPYQRVTTATDYDTSGFTHYLTFDGVDDWMVTPSIDFTATDKMTVLAGVRKLSDAAQSVLVELSTSVANAGAFGIFAPASAAANYSFGSTGSVFSNAVASGFAAPVTNVLACIGDISGDKATLRLNSVQAAQSVTDQGTGNYGNYPLYIGRRGGTTLPFNGRMYGLIVRGAQSNDAQIVACERFMNQRTGAF